MDGIQITEVVQIEGRRLQSSLALRPRLVLQVLLLLLVLVRSVHHVRGRVLEIAIDQHPIVVVVVANGGAGGCAGSTAERYGNTEQGGEGDVQRGVLEAPPVRRGRHALGAVQRVIRHQVQLGRQVRTAAVRAEEVVVEGQGGVDHGRDRIFGPVLVEVLQFQVVVAEDVVPADVVVVVVIVIAVVSVDVLHRSETAVRHADVGYGFQHLKSLLVVFAVDWMQLRRRDQESVRLKVAQAVGRRRVGEQFLVRRGLHDGDRLQVGEHLHV